MIVVLVFCHPQVNWNQMVTSSPKWFRIYHRYNKQKLPSWWFQPIWKKYQSNWDHFPKFRDEHKTYLKPTPPVTVLKARRNVKLKLSGPNYFENVTIRSWRYHWNHWMFRHSQVAWNAETSKRYKPNKSCFQTSITRMLPLSILQLPRWLAQFPAFHKNERIILKNNYFIDYSSGPL